MMSDMLKKYNHFVHEMWNANTEERQAYGEPILSKEEYILENNTFLEDTFWINQYGDKVWDGEKYTERRNINGVQ